MQVVPFWSLQLMTQAIFFPVSFTKDQTKDYITGVQEVYKSDHDKTGW